MRLSLTLVAMLLVVLPIVSAQEADHPLLLVNNLELATQTGIIVGILSVITIFTIKYMGKKTKKAVFILFIAIIGTSTAIMDASLVYANFTSVTGGPVHWHAHLEFDFCGVSYSLPEYNIAVEKPIHTHGDNLIHIETTPHRWDDVQTHLFFENLGGEFTRNSLAIPTAQGMVRVQNGDLCNGAPGSLKMYVNGNLEPLMDRYVISPVEAGDIDQIKFVFDSE